MVEAFVADLASGLVAKLVSLASEEVIQAWKLEHNLQELRERLELIDALLFDADTKRVTMSSVQNWLNKLEAIVHVANEFMDELGYEVTRKKVENKHKVKDFFLPSKNSILYRFNVARRIKSINASFDKVSKSAISIGLKPVEHLSSIVQPRMSRNTPPSEDESLIVGRGDHASDLIKMVCNNYEESLPVIAVVGMGGLGKTTLARMVYNSVDVINVFPKRMWVSVSDDFDFMRILNEMVELLDANTPVSRNIGRVIENLRTHLNREKFLLVLDDVWNEKSGEWGNLKNSLLGVGIGSRESKILVTTRNYEVIATMQTSLTYVVKGLSRDDSWTLFKQRAFALGGVFKNENFEVIGRSMVERCGGLPLAIKTLGGLLRSKKSEEEWLLIRDSEIWKSRDVLPSLRLSYDNLPSLSLKHCFAYCSVLPKGFNIHKDRLVEIWMALGFLLPPRGSNLMMEDVGNEYFNILLWNSLLQDVEKDEYDNITSCKMHDLVHDLALDVSTNYSATIESNHRLKHISYARYIWLENQIEEIKPITIEGKFERVQALYAGPHVLGNMLPSLKHLTVLVVFYGGQSVELPSSLGKLIFLKHLDISHFHTRDRMPNSITKLYNLQSLRVGNISKLPEDFGNLINLRHLFVGSYDCSITGIERFTCLQTLPYFVVSRDKKCHIGQLGGLKHLKGKLDLYGLRDVENIEEASKANLYEKCNIQTLSLNWRKDEDEGEDNLGYSDEDDVMEGLKPHANLKELEIAYFMGKKIASWIVMMRSLVKVKLRHCNRCEGILPLGELPELREIEIDGMKNVKVITSGETDAAETTDTTTFPSLRKLIMWNMPKLEAWLGPVLSRGHEDEGTTLLLLPKLEELHICDCPELTRIPDSYFPSLKNLRVQNLNNSRIVETMSRKLTSLTTLRLWNIRRGREGSSSSTSSSLSMDYIVEELLRNNYASLRKLELYKCEGLTCLTLGNNNVALEILSVLNCPKLTSISVSEGSGALISLKYLEIMGCPNLVYLADSLLGRSVRSRLERLWLGPFSEDLDEFLWPLSFLSSEVLFPNLTFMRLTGWEKLNSILPEHDLFSSTFPALTELWLTDFERLVALPDSLENLPFLELVEIVGCRKLARLPKFGKLQSLGISNCPILGRLLILGSASEWGKIQHIPDIRLNQEKLVHPGEEWLRNDEGLQGNLRQLVLSDSVRRVLNHQMLAHHNS